MTNKISRRRFLEDSLLLLTAASVPVKVFARDKDGPRQTVSPNEKIHVAVIGMNGQGMSHLNAFAGMNDVIITALCDADSAVLERAVSALEKKGRPAPKTYQDIRRMLEDKQIDAVSIATPNHWHALAAIWAMQAGKDVYVEKPVSHNVSEGRRMVEAAKRYNKICQAGTQSRANKGMQEAMAYLHEGKLGKITLARALCYKPRKSIGMVTTPQTPPATVDYDLWLGPAPKKPVTRERFHYDWHWFWDYGNGDLGNQGVHETDKARWGLGKDTLPKSVITLGGRFGYRDNGETPNTELAFYDYGDVHLIFEVRGLDTPDYKGAKIGNIWYGTEGYMVAPNNSSAVVYDNNGNKVKEFSGGGDHPRNFIEAVRSRRADKLFCPVSEGHQSAALCHVANVSYRLGTMLPFNKKTGAFGDDTDAIETIGRFEEHLTANGVNLDNWSYRLGPRLKIDTKNETFVDNHNANQLLTRDYRDPFVVPERL